jgi:hypothetical protein
VPRKGSLFNKKKMALGKLEVHMQKNETRPLSLTSYKKINSKWIIWAGAEVVHHLSRKHKEWSSNPSTAKRNK